MQIYSKGSLCCLCFLIILCFILFVLNIVALAYSGINLSQYTDDFWIKCGGYGTLQILSITEIICCCLPIICITIIIFIFCRQIFHCIFPFIFLIIIFVIGTTVLNVLFYNSSTSDGGNEEKQKIISNFKNNISCRESVIQKFNCQNNETLCYTSLTQLLSDQLTSTSNTFFALEICFFIIDFFTIIALICLFSHCSCGLQASMRRV